MEMFMYLYEIKYYMEYIYTMIPKSLHIIDTKW